jgi:integrase
MNLGIDDFRIWLDKRGRGRSVEQYCRVVRAWLKDREGFERKMVSSDYAPNYRRHLIACLRMWARFTEDGDLLLRLGDIKRPPPVPKGVREPLGSEDWFKVLDAIDSSKKLSDPVRLVCGVIALRGIRCGDVLRLVKQDVQRAVETGTLAFESKGERWQSFNAEPLRGHLEGLLACRWRGRRVRNLVSPGASEGQAQETAGREIRKAFDQIADEINVSRQDLFAHRFRHTYATLFLQEMAGDPEAIFKLQQQMGWARLDTAANYLRRSRRKELDAIESRLLSGRRTNT